MGFASKLSKWIREKFFSWTFLKFGVVGGSGVAVNFIVFWILTVILEVNHLAASVVATEIAILNNFTFNHLWTFKERRGQLGLAMRLLNFHGSRILGLLVTVGTLYLLADIMQLNVFISYIFAIGLGTLANFVTSDLFVWPEQEPYKR